MLSNRILQHSTYQKLRKNNTYSYKVITDISDLTISSYLTSIASGNRTPENRYSAIAVEVLKVNLSQYLEESEVNEAIRDFRKFPAIQTADHIGLFYDFTNFINNFFWNIALENNGIRHLFACQCETIRSVQNTRAFLGPGFIKLNKNVYNVFGLSKNKLKNTNIAALDNCRFVFDPVFGKNEFQFPDILEMIIAVSQKTGYAPDKFHKANLLFWDNMTYSKKSKMILFDQRFYCDIIAENILNGESLIELILFDGDARKSFLEIKSAVIRSPENLIMRNTTDFFYLKKNQELVPLKINDEGIFHDARTGKTATVGGKIIKAEKDILIDNLRERNLYPDLMLSNVFGHILPGIVAVGGTSQLEYLPVIVKILEIFLAKNDLATKGDSTLNPAKYGRLTGPSLVAFSEADRNFIESLTTASDLDEFQSTFYQKRIGDALNIEFWNYFDIFYARKEKQLKL